MCFLTLVGSKTNSSSVDHWGKWMAFIIVISKQIRQPKVEAGKVDYAPFTQIEVRVIKSFSVE
jgi:hypothetical protein